MGFLTEILMRHETIRSLLCIDHHNSVMGDAPQVNQHSYTAFGYGESGAGLAFNGQLRERFCGHYVLGNGYRVYIPALMRFNSPDSVSPFGMGGLNTYAYASGDPINRIDPTGHFSLIKKIRNFFRRTPKAPEPRVSISREVLFKPNTFYDSMPNGHTNGFIRMEREARQALDAHIADMTTRLANDSSLLGKSLAAYSRIDVQGANRITNVIEMSNNATTQLYNQLQDIKSMQGSALIYWIDTALQTPSSPSMTLAQSIVNDIVNHRWRSNSMHYADIKPSRLRSIRDIAYGLDNIGDLR